MLDRVIAKLRKRAKGKLGNESGFTLLELLVVVAILAAIAGTATIALQDTDARASAAAHVAMMDELNKGIRTYRVLRGNSLPNHWDSLLEKADVATPAVANGFAGGALGGVTSILGIDGADFSTILPTADMATNLIAGGITNLQYIQNDLTVTGDSCASIDLAQTIGSRGNAVVAGNIFMTPAGNGCGASVAVAATEPVAIWIGGFERLLGGEGAAFDGTPYVSSGAAVTGGAQDAPILMAVGVGPSSSLFNANELGGMTSTPVYRHVGATTYNRFIAFFELGTWDLANTAMVANGQVVFSGVVDGAGDTKEEELGEWDGSRNTI